MIYIKFFKGSIINTKSKKIIIKNEQGLHARPAAMIAKIAQKAESGVWIIKDGHKVEATSIIDMLTFECAKGSKIIVQIDNQSDIEILNEIVELIEGGFEES